MEALWFIGLIILIIFSLRFIFNSDQKRYQQLSAVYIAWAFINLVLLATSDKDSSGIFPFDGENIDKYDYGEFLLYVFGPLVYNYVRNRMRAN
jgi:hypothetical protein